MIPSSPRGSSTFWFVNVEEKDPTRSFFYRVMSNIEWVFLKPTLVRNCLQDAASGNYWAKREIVLLSKKTI